MNIEIEARPSYALAVVTLDKGESMTVESGAMVGMSAELSVESTFPGASGGGLDWVTSFFVALVRKFLAGERMIVNVFKAKNPGQRLMLAPAMIGDLVHVQLDGQRKVTVQAGSFVACGPKVKQRLVWGGLAMLFSGEGAFFLEMSGQGDLLINSYGGIEEVEVDGKYVVDSGHVAAWEGKELKYSLKKAGGWATAALSGEGFVLEFSGKGKVWLQTRNLSSLIGWITPYFS